MFIYRLRSTLFINQDRIIISNWCIKDWIVESMANLDNNYDDDKRWKLVQ